MSGTTRHVNRDLMVHTSAVLGGGRWIAFRAKPGDRLLGVGTNSRILITVLGPAAGQFQVDQISIQIGEGASTLVLVGDNLSLQVAADGAKELYGVIEFL